VVTLDWTPQRRTDLALAITALTALAALILIVVARRRAPLLAEAGPALRGDTAPARWPLAVAAGAVAFVAISPIYAVLIVAALLFGRGRAATWRLGGAAVAAALVIGGGYAAEVLLFTPTPGFGFVSQFEWAHRPALMVALLVAVALSIPDRRSDEAR